MPTVSRPAQITALQPAWPATWLSPLPPAALVGNLLGLASGNQQVPMLAGGGWPGAAGSGAATGSAAERSLPPLPSWLAAAAAASAGSTDYLQGRALPARPLALAAGSGHRARLARLVRGTRPAGGLSAGNRGATGLLVAAAAAAAAAMTGGGGGVQLSRRRSLLAGGAAFESNACRHLSPRPCHPWAGPALSLAVISRSESF